MRAIFLDFDGVIRIPVPTGGPEIEAEYSSDRMKRVAKLAEECEARIVISSDWRLRLDRAGMVELLEPAIGRDLLHRNWQTPHLTGKIRGDGDFQVPRGAEIIAWLALNPEVTEFVVLDDMPSKHFPLMQEHLVSCNLLDGFTEERFEYASGLFLLSAA